MPTKRGRTLSSFGQLFGTISGGKPPVIPHIEGTIILIEIPDGNVKLIEQVIGNVFLIESHTGNIILDRTI